MLCTSSYGLLTRGYSLFVHVLESLVPLHYRYFIVTLAEFVFASDILFEVPIDAFLIDIIVLDVSFLGLVDGHAVPVLLG